MGQRESDNLVFRLAIDERQSSGWWVSGRHDRCATKGLLGEGGGRLGLGFGLKSVD